MDQIKSDCIKDSLELLKHISSSKKISEAKDIIDTICDEKYRIEKIVQY